MSRRLVSITLDTLGDLPTPCRSCVYWELDPALGARAAEPGDTALKNPSLDNTALDKEAWISDTLLEWGSCGLIAYVDGMAAGYALYAPPAYVPRSLAFATAPVSPDAVLLMTARVLPAYTGTGLGRMLVQGVAREVVRRGIRAVEAFGRHSPDRPESDRPESDWPESDRAHSCLLPAGYLLAVGFKTVRHHPATPRLRLDIRSTATWREDVESALERILSSIHAPAGVRS
jgi:GNAT superfamily N-acetyltransferase